MRAHYLQHVPFEGLGTIEPWLSAAGYEITSSRFFESAILPEVDDIELLVVMGGPMSVNEEVDLPWLSQEKDFIRDTIEAGKPVLGVCLGAQLIATAMGAQVRGNPDKEIGWFPVQAVRSDDASIFRFPQSVEVFHWHGETFDLPVGAIRVAKSRACENQAFQLGRAVIGLQFHLETTPESARQIIEHCRDELEPAKYVQSAADMLAAPAEKYRVINELMSDVLAFLTGTHGQG